MRTNIQLLIGLCLTLGTVQVGAAVTGRVFVDSNRNGIYDNGERTLKGVSLSDGWHVTSTDASGMYSLEGFEGMRFVFITTPSGYMTQQGGYYRHYDNGVGKYDFGVEPMPAGRIGKDGSHSFIQISDTEIFNEPGYTRWRDDLRDYANSEHPAFIVHTGDICYDRGLKEHIKIMNTANMNTPVFYMLGNHDLVKGKYGEELFESIYGPSWYSFNVGNTHYVVTPMAGGDYSPSYNGDQISRWLKNDLRQLKHGTPVVVFNHNLTTSNGNFGFGEADRINLNEYNLKAWLYGHWHNHYVQRQGNTLAIGTSPVSFGGIDHSTSAYRVLNVDGNGNLKSDLRYAYVDARVRIVLASKNVTGGKLKLNIVGNAYSSMALTKGVKVTVIAEGKQVAQVQLTRRTDWTWKRQISLSAKYAERKLDIKATATFDDGKTATCDYAYTPQAENAVPSLAADWTNLGGNAAHTGIAADTLGSDMRLAWTCNLGSNIFMSSPLIYGGNVYVATVDENGGNGCAVFALDGKTGRMLWHTPVDYSVRGTIVAAAGHIFAQDISGVLYMIDAADGKVLKRRQMEVDGLPVLDDGLATKDGIVYAGSGQALCAVDANSGELIWKGKGWKRGEGTVSTITVTDNDRLVHGVQWTGLFANCVKDGSFLWQNLGDGLRFRASSPSAHGSLLYTTSDDSFYIIDESTGKVAVRKPLAMKMEVPSTPLVTGSEIIFGTGDQGLVALDSKTLDRKWQFKTGTSLVFTTPYTHQPFATVATSPVLAGENVYFGASDGCIYGVDRTTGKKVFCYDTGAPVFSSPAISTGTMVICDFGGNVYMFN